MAFWREGIQKVYIPFLYAKPIYSYIAFIDNNSNEVIRVKKGSDDSIAAAAEGELRSLSDELIFKGIFKLDYGKTYLSRSDGLIEMVTPVYHLNQKKGMIELEMKMDEIYSIVAPMKYGEKKHTMLFTDKGNLLFCTRGLTEEHHKGEIDYILKNPSDGYTEIAESHGEKNILMSMNSLKLHGERWLVAMESTTDEITERIKEFEQQKKRLIIFLILIGIVVLSYLFKIILDKAQHEKSLENLNNELNIANKKLVDVDKQKTEFLNIVAHDLRTPLTSIRSYTEMLLTNKDKPDMSHMLDNFINAISHEGIRLENLVNEYLDMAKIESGTMTFNKSPVDIKMLINWSIETFRGEAMAKGININFPLHENIPLTTADEGKLSQVISNLLSNAVKFTPRGGAITVSAGRKEDYLEVYVEDTGPGIPNGYKERIFEKFFQVESGGERVKKGVGLGLPIVKFIVEQHGGKVWVESDMGKGAKFLFTLPIEQKGSISTVL
ncbi:MAG: sensor histidine kinase [Nitrospinae bacterium]|nr:sensor histidine kinase [Nitrospinota bacterium]